MRAWLVTWEWTGDAAAVADKVAAILNPRWSSDHVAGILQFLYTKRFSTASELAEYARRPASNPYQAKTDLNSRIEYGGHPFLFARLVDDLSVSQNPETLIETITWTEPPIYGPYEKGAARILRGAMAGQTVVRRISGALSDELIYDRVQGRFKPGWEP
jgi:hypothetical protein